MMGASDKSWLPIAGYPYEVSDAGDVRNSAGRQITSRADEDGYLRVTLYLGGSRRKFRVHRLVCAAFHGDQPAGCEVGHLDGSRTNNAASNLAWVTRSENVRHSIGHGTFKTGIRSAIDAIRGMQRFGEEAPSHKLTWPQVNELRALRQSGWSERRLADKFGVSRGQIHRIVTGECWPKEAEHA